MRLLLIMASYQPPSEFLPIFDNSVFTATNGSSTSTGGGLTLAQANLLYLRKNFPDICTALETFNGGISTTFLNASGNIQSNTKLITNNIESILVGDTVTLYNNQTNGVLNIASNNTRTANINIGTSATSGQASLGSNSNTQTNIYGGAIYLANPTSINGDLTMSAGVIIGYLTSALAASTYATIASLSSYLTIASASATYLTLISASTTYATIASLSNYLTIASASATYLTLISASTTYATIASLSAYLTTASAASTYATIASLSAYLTTASAASTYATIASLSSYLTTASAASTYLSIVDASTTYLTQANAVLTYLTIATASTTYATIASLGSYLTTASASSTYLSIVDASTTYLTQANAVLSYLTIATASTTYATIASLGSYLTTASAATTYATIASLGSYLTTASAATTYATIASLGSYLTTASAATTYATIASLGSYLTIASASSTYAPKTAPTFATSITLTSGNITASSGNIIANGIIRNNGNTGSISNTGAIVGTSLSLGSGDITTVGDITSSGTISAIELSTSLNGNLILGTGDITSCGNITASGDLIVDGPITSNNGTITGVTYNPNNFNDDMKYGDTQTTGNMFIGGNSSRTGSINIGNNSTSTASGIFIGNSFAPTVVDGNLTVNGTLTASGFTFTSIVIDAITATFSSSTVNLYNNLVSGILNLACGTGRTGDINIGINATTPTSNIILGSLNTDTKIKGKLYTDTITTDTPSGTGDVRLYEDVTSGNLNFGCGTGRTANINIGINATTPTSNIILGSLNTDTKIKGKLYTDTITTDTPSGTGSVRLYDDVTSGNLNFGCGPSRTGLIRIGTGASAVTSGITLGSSNTDVTVNGDLIMDNTANIYTQTLTTNAPGANTRLYDDLISGRLFIGSGTGRTGGIRIGIGATALTENIVLGSVNTNISAGGTLTAAKGLILDDGQGITCGTPPTLITSSLGYFYNFPLRTNTGIASGATGYRYNPQTNTVGNPNFVKAGVYYAKIDVIYRFTGNPTAFNLNYNFGIASGVTAGTATTANMTDILPVSRTNTGSFISGANNNDFCASHSVCFTLTTDSYVNIFFNITVLTQTFGSLTINSEGTIFRIA